MNPTVKIQHGDVLAELQKLASDSVHSFISSPPYYGLRHYGIPASTWPTGWVGVHGLEPTLDLFVQHEVIIWREARRVLRPDGVLCLNLGDSYSGSWGNMSGDTRGNGTERERKKGSQVKSGAQENMKDLRPPTSYKQAGLKDKDMFGVPWTVALALRADGWYLRRDIVWSKPNPMPESAKDRPTTAHEYLFVLSKSEVYFWDWWAIREPCTGNAHPRSAAASSFPAEAERNGEARRRPGVNPKAVAGWAQHGKHNAADHAKPGGSYKGSVPGRKDGPGQERRSKKPRQNPSFSEAVAGNHMAEFRNSRSVWSHDDARGLLDWLAGQPEGGALLARFTCEAAHPGSVWTIPTRGYAGAHFATFPTDFARKCVRASTSARGVCAHCGTPYRRVLDELELTTLDWESRCACPLSAPVPAVSCDPFAGSGTVGEVCLEEGRSALLIELGQHHIPLIERRCSVTPQLALCDPRTT